MYKKIIEEAVSLEVSNPKRSIELYESVAKNDDVNQIIIYNKLSELYNNISDTGNSIKYREKMLILNPKDYLNIHELSLLYLKNSQIEESKRLFIKIIRSKIADHRLLHLSLCHFNSMMDLYIQEFIAYIHITLKINTDLSKQLKLLIHQALMMEYNGIYSKDIEKITEVLESEKEDKDGVLEYEKYGDIDIDNIYNEHYKVNDYFDKVEIYKFDDKKINKKIRVGYVSSDFRSHAVSKFLKNIIKDHDKKKFDIYCYNIHNMKDKDTQHYVEHSTFFKDVHTFSDNDIADIIYKDNIDILIDLNGHTGLNKIGIFALKPAPIQITYLGYPNTTGLKQMDYRITDKNVDPITSKQKYTEKLLRLDCPFHNYVYPTLNYGYCHHGHNEVVFGISNRYRKQSPIFLSTVRSILATKPNSLIKILIHSNCYPAKHLVEFYYKKLGVDGNRLIIHSGLSDEQYFAFYNSIDVLLDTFPYSGSTITCDSLYMSTPIVTLNREHSHVHNVTSSIIKHITPELITYSITEYIIKATTITKGEIYHYKQTIHDKFCSVMKSEIFMKNYEKILEDVYISDIFNKYSKNDVQPEENKLNIYTGDNKLNIYTGDNKTNIDNKLNKLNIYTGDNKETELYKDYGTYLKININEIITGERIQLECDSFIGNSEDFNYNQKITNNNKCYNIDGFVKKENKEKIFIYTHQLNNDKLYKHLEEFTNIFDVIIHNSDHELLPQHLVKLKNIEKLRHIYSQNVNINDICITPIPIGIANSMWKHGDLKVWENMEIHKKKDEFIFFNFNCTTAIARTTCYNYFINKIPHTDNIDNYKDYLETLNKYKYCLCPDGNGTDTHRLWECLYLGVIPICLKTPLTEYYSKFVPIVLLNSWYEINFDDLRKNYSKYSYFRKVSVEKLMLKNILK